MATTSQRKRIEGWAVNVADCCGPTVKTFSNPHIPRQILYPSPPPSILADLPDASPPGYLSRPSSHRNKGSKATHEPFTITEREVNKSPEKPVTVTRRYKSTRESSSPPRRTAPSISRTAVRSSHASDDGKPDRRSQYSRSDARTERRTSRDEHIYRERDSYEQDRRTRASRHDSPLELVDVTRIPSRRSSSRSPKQSQSVLRRVFRLPERESRRTYYEDSGRGSSRTRRRLPSLDRREYAGSGAGRTRSVDGHSLAYGERRRDSRETRSVYAPDERVYYLDDRDRRYREKDRDRERERDTFIIDSRPKRSTSLRSRTGRKADSYDDDFMGRWGEGFGRWAFGTKDRDWDSRDGGGGGGGGSGRRVTRLPRPPVPPPLSSSAWEAKRLSGRDFDGWYARDSRRY